MKDDHLWEQWVDLYGNRVTRLAYSYLNDWLASQDHVQNALIKAYEKRHQLKDDSQVFSWLARIVINECKMAKRGRWREILTNLLPETKVLSAEEEAMAVHLNHSLYNEVMKLEEKYRLPIVLHYFESMTIEEIANLLNEQPGTIKSRMSRARNRLKNKWEESEYGTRVRKSEAYL